MNAVVQAPLELLEALSDLRLPPKLDAKLQVLMDRNTGAALTPGDREDLESLVEWSQAGVIPVPAGVRASP